MTARGWPLLRPIVVSSRDGIPPKLAPNRLPVTFSSTRWVVFIALRTRSLGIRPR